MSQKQIEHSKEYNKNISQEKLNDYDLFDNPMVRAAKAAIPLKDQERYKRKGEEMYGSVDFETNEALNNMPAPMVEALSCLTHQLDFGLLPSDTSADEKNLLVEAYGEKWYEKWNFVEKDLTENFTTKF